jgi:hypothetical protein
LEAVRWIIVGNLLYALLWESWIRGSGDFRARYFGFEMEPGTLTAA